MSAPVKEKLFRYIDKHREDIVDFLCEYIRLRPVNPGIPGKGEELAAQNWLRDELGEFGFDKVDYWAADSDQTGPNVVGGIKGTGVGNSLIFNGHTDVVPVPESQLQRWTVDPWRPTVKDGRVYGRGSSDMLGGNAATIWTAKALIDSGVKLKGDIYVECVVGEESNEGASIGTATTIDRGYVAPFAIVAEPTKADEIRTATCGTFIFEMTVIGKGTHTATKNLITYPQRYGLQQGSEVGVDAIGKTMRFLSAFRDLERNWVLRWRHPILGGGGYPIPKDTQGVGVFTITPTLIEGGTYVAAIADYCKVTCQVYYPSWKTAKEVWNEVKGVMESVSLTDDWLREHPPKLKIDRSVEGDVQYIPHWDPNEVSPNHGGCKALATAFSEVVGREAIFSGFKAVCDATHFGKKGIPAVILGPGDECAGVHGTDEYITIDDIIKCCKIYLAMAVDWCRVSGR